MQSKPSSLATAPAARTLYKAQQYDTDCECWEDMDHEGCQGFDRYTVEQEAKYEARKCAYRVRVRVVPA